MKKHILTYPMAALGLLLALARPALGQAPAFSAALSIGSSGANDTASGQATATNAAGDQFVTGSFSSTIVLGSTTLVSAGSDDIFVAKRSGSTGAWLWAVRAGGPGLDQGRGVAVDAGGNALVTGFFSATAMFATRPAATSLTSAGSDDVFVAKFAGTDGAAAWAVGAGGTNSDTGNDVAVDAGGNALVTGFFQTIAAFATRPAATALISAGSDDVFVAKFAGTDGAAAWAVGSGGTGTDWGNGVAVDAGGNALVTGYFSTTATFATRPVVTSLTSAGSDDVFVAKFAGTNGAAAWAVGAGGIGIDWGNDVAVDAGGNALVTGRFLLAVTFDTRPAATSLTSAGDYDVFVAKFAGTDGTVAWVVGAGGFGADYGNGIALDGGGNALVTGSFSATATFAARPMAISLTSVNGSQDVFVAKFAGTDGAAALAVRAGGPGTDQSFGVAVDGGGNALVTGRFFGTTATFGSLALVGSNGGSTGFVAKLTGAGSPLAARPTAPAPQLVIYPNPSTGRLTVRRPAGAAAAPAVLRNALGQAVRTLPLPTPETTLDLRGLPPGLYTLHLTLDGQPVSRRVVLE